MNELPELPARKILPLSKRARIADDDLPFDSDLSPTSLSHRRRRSSQLKILQVHPSFTPKEPSKPTSALLTPCHICHRKPTKKSDLDSFAECQGCRERTCFVCIRQCPGWNVDDGSVLSEQEILSRSFHMDDIDDLRAQEHTERKQNTDGGRKGWIAGGHRTVVCSRCCIERGVEGDVACLGCLSRMEGA